MSDELASETDAAALRERGARCARAHEWAEVARISERLAELAKSPEEKGVWRARVAQLWAERLGRKADAARVYLELVAEGQRTPEVVAALEKLAAEGVQPQEIQLALEAPSADVLDLRRRVQGEAEDWAALSQTLAFIWSQERHTARGRDAAVQLAVLKDEKLGDTRAAIDLCGQVLSQDPQHAQARETLAARVELPSIDGAAALEILDPILAHEGRHAERAELREARLRVANDTEKPRLVRDVIALWEGPLRDPDRALLSGLQAFASGLDRASLAPVLERLAAVAGSLDEIAELFEGAADQLMPGDPECGVMLKRAARIRQKLGDFETASRLWNEVLGELPGDVEASAAKATLLLDAAAKHEREGDDDAAIESYRTAYALRPSSEPLVALDRLYKRTQRFAEQAEVLDRLSRSGSQPENARVAWLERAELLVKAGLHEAALGAFTEALDRWPGEPRAVSGLQSLLGVDTLRAEVARVLEPVYRAQGDEGGLADVLDVRADGAAPGAREPVLRELAALREARGQHAEAFAALRRAFAEAPTHAEVRAELERLAEAHGLLDELVAAYEDALDRAEGNAAAPLWRTVAQIEERLGHGPQAVRAWEQLARLAPRDASPLEALARIHAAAEDRRAQVDALMRMERTEALLQAARIADHTLCDRELAAACYRRVLEREPDHADALASLERLLHAGGKFDQLAPVLQQEIRAAEARGAADQVQSLLLRWADVQLEHGGDASQALGAYRRVLALSPSHLDAVAGLEKMALSGGPSAAEAGRALLPVLERGSDKLRLVRVLRALIASSADTQERVNLSLRMAELYAGPLHEPSSAFLATAEALRLTPDSGPLLDRTFELAARAETNEELCALLEELAGAVATPETRVRLLLRLARAQEAMSEWDGAIDAWQRIVRDVPGHAEALDRLEALLEANGRYDTLAEIFDRRLALAQTREERLRVLKRLAAAQELGGQASAAVETLHAALDLQPDAGILGSLQRLLGELGRHLERADALWQLATLAQDDGTRRRHLLHCGEAFAQGGRPDAAADAFAAVLATDSADTHAVAGLEQLLSEPSAKGRAARALEPAFRAWGDAAKLVTVLDIELADAEPIQRKPLLEEIARLRETLGELPLAFAALLVCFAEDPTDARVRADAERLAAATGGYGELADEYRAQLERGLPAALELELSRKLALLYATTLSRPDLAISAWKGVLERSPRHAEALRALAQLYLANGDYDSLAGVLERQIEVEPTGGRRTEALLMLAQVADERLGNKGRAIEACRTVLVETPQQPDASAYLESLLEETGRHDELSDHLEARARLAESQGDEDGAIDLRVRMARTVAREPGRSLPVLEDVLRRRPGHEGAIEALEEMMRPGSLERSDAAALLEPIYEWRQDHARLVDAMEARLSSETQVERRLGLLRRIAELQAGPLWNPPAAFLASARALQEAPDDEGALKGCLAWHEVAGASGELMALLEEVAPRASQKAAPQLNAALASLHEQQGHDADAIAGWHRVLELGSDEAEPLAHLAKLFERRGRWAELLEVLRRQSAAASEPARAELLARICDLLEHKLNDTAAALDNARALLALSPDSPSALARLDRLCVAEEQWPELEGVLRARLRLAPADAREELELRLAELCESRLDQRAEAISLYEALLERDPRHPDALPRLETLCERTPADIRIKDVLAHAYRASHARAKLAALLERRSQEEPNLSARRALRLELVALREQLEEPELAFLALSRAFEDEPGDGQLLERLERMAVASSMEDALAQVLEHAVAGAADPRLAGALCLKVAALHDGADGPEASLPWLQKARELDSGAEPAALEALTSAFERLERWADLAEVYERMLALDSTRLETARALEQLYARTGEPERRLRALDRVRGLTHGPEREAALLVMAQLCADQLEDMGRAVAFCRTLLEENPQSLPAFELLSGLLEDAGRNEELRALLESRLEWTFDPHALAALHERLGQLLWKVFDDPAKAEPHFQEAVEREQRNDGALEALWRVSEQLGHLGELPDVLRRLSSLRGRGPTAKEPTLRLAELLAGAKDGGKAEALDAAQRAFAAAPHSAKELTRLLDVFRALDARAMAVEALELRAEAAGQAGQAPDAIAALWEAEGLLERDGLDDERIHTLGRILGLEPSHRDAHERLVPLLSKLGYWDRYVEAERHFLPFFDSPADRCAALERVAQIQEQKLDDVPGAFASLCDAFRLAPGNDAMLASAARLGELTGDESAFAAVLEDVAHALPKSSVAVRRYLALARLCDAKLDDLDRAQAALQHALDIQPDCLDAFDALSELHLRRGLFPGYVAALERKREVVRSAQDRRAIDLEVARVHDELLGDPDGATAALERALDVGADPETALALADLNKRHQRWAEAIRALLLARDLMPSPEERLRVQLEIASLQREKLADPEAAIEAYRRALETDGASAEAADALESLYAEVGSHGDLLQLYEARLARETDSADRIALLFRCASLREERLGDAAGADECLESVLRIDSRNIAALQGLVRLRRTSGKGKERASALTRLAQVSTDRAEQVAAHTELAQVQRDVLRDPDKAVTSYLQALELAPRERSLLQALAALYQGKLEWGRALDMIQREAKLADRGEASALYQRAGELYLEKLKDANGAKSAFRQALSAQASNVAALRALAQIHAKERDWSAYEEVVAAEATHATERGDKLSAVLQLARHFAERKRDAAAASKWYGEALRVDPECLDAAAPLTQLAVERKDWPVAEKMLQLLSRKAVERAGGKESALATDAAHELHRLAHVSLELGKEDQALEALRQAARLDPGSQLIHEGLAALLVKKQILPEALEVYQGLLMRHGHQMGPAAAAALRCEMGQVHVQLGQWGPAKSHFERALALSPGNARVLAGLAHVADQSGDARGSADYRHKQMKAAGGEERFRIARELGELASGSLHDASLAIEAYGEALKVKPGDVPSLEALWPLYRQVGQPDRAVQSLHALLETAEVGKDPDRRKRLLFELGGVLASDKRDLPGGLEALNAALDVDFQYTDALQALESLLSGAKRWRQLDDNYGRMLARIPEVDITAALRMSLWRARGDVRARALNDAEGALAAYRTAAEGLPEDAALQEALGHHAMALGGHEATAIAAFRRALPTSADPARLCVVLGELAAKTKDFDSAFLTTHALAELLGKAAQTEHAVLDLLGPHARANEQAKRALTNSHWRDHLYHPFVRGPLAELMGILCEQAGTSWATSHSAYGINAKKHQLDVRAAPVGTNISHVQYVGTLLGGGAPQVFSPHVFAPQDAGRSGDRSDIELCWTSPPSVRLGAAFFREGEVHELRARIAFALTYLRPDLALAKALPLERLELLVQAALSIGGAEVRVTADPKLFKKERKAIERALSPSARAALENVVRQYAPRAKPEDVRNYVRGAELTAARAALLAACEAPAVLHAVTDKRGVLSSVTRDEAIRDLVTFAAGGGLHALRVAVGTSIDVAASSAPDGGIGPGTGKVARA